MSWRFESQLSYDSPSTDAQGNPVVCNCMVAVSELEVWVGWSDGTVTWHTHVHDKQYTSDNCYIGVPDIQFTDPIFGTVQTPQISTVEGVVTHVAKPLSMTKWHDSVYVHFSSRAGGTPGQILQYKTNTRALRNYSGNFPVQEYTAINSPIFAANGRIFCTTFTPDNNEQQLLISFAHNASMSIFGGTTWSNPITLPGRHQTTPRRIIDGLDGKLYVTNMNNHSIIEINLDGMYVTNTYMINRHPYSLAVNQNKELFIMSDAGGTVGQGMVHLFNQSDNSYAPFCSAVGDCDIFLDDLRTGYVWMLGGDGGTTTRMIKETQFVFTTGTKGVDGDTPTLVSTNETNDAYIVEADNSLRIWDGSVFNVSTGPASTTLNVKGKVATVDDLPSPSLPDAIKLDVLNGQHAVMTQEVTFDYFDPGDQSTTNHTVRPYLYVANGTKLRAYRLTSLVRVNSCTVRGTAMISVGDQSYFGD